MMETNDKNTGGSVQIHPVLHAILEKIIEVSGTSNEQLKNQEEASRRQGDMLLQHGEVLKQHGELLQNQGTALGLLASTIEKQYATIDLQMKSHVYYLQESQKQGFKKLQKQIDAMKAGDNVNKSPGSQSLSAGSGSHPPTPIERAHVPEAGGRRSHPTNRKFTLGLRKEAIRKIQDIKARDLCGTRRAMDQLLKLEKFAGTNLPNLHVWWKKRDKIIQHLRTYPGDADKYRMRMSKKLD